MKLTQSTALILVLLSACTASLPKGRATIEVIIDSSQANQIRIDWVQPSSETDRPQMEVHDPLIWELCGPFGKVLASGRLSDPRWGFADYMGEDGKLHGGRFKSDNGVLVLDIPAVKGELRILDPEGKLLGRTPFNPGSMKPGPGR
ncbi:MAG: hypothetical protein WC001_11595 [Desulfurivibrionaceae bacterium]